MSDIVRLDVEMSTSTAHRLSHYDGVCSSIHGHNIGWDVTLGLSFEENHEDNMSVDFKDVSDVIDEVDHALLLNKGDPIAQERIDNDDWRWEDGNQSNPVLGWTEFKTEKYGQVFIFDGDPTVEVLADWMISRFFSEFEDAVHAKVDVAETDKYTLTRAGRREQYV